MELVTIGRARSWKYVYSRRNQVMENWLHLELLGHRNLKTVRISRSWTTKTVRIIRSWKSEIIRTSMNILEEKYSNNICREYMDKL
jgi:hypothetical protein